MAKRTTITDPTTKRTRVRKPQYYLATITGREAPLIVVAATHKIALAAIVHLIEATAAALIEAGKAGYEVLDTTVEPAA